jgi:hypothetical protein
MATHAVAHALKVRQAMNLGNYHAMGQLYRTAPNMGRFIMDHFIDGLRIRALQAICRA